MWETVKELLVSQEIWSAIVYLLLGGFVGAIISVLYSLRARRPKLVVSGQGSGGNQQNYTWRINISNRPSFLGQALEGESARDVRAHIRLDERRSQSYLVYWGHQRERYATIDPGQQASLELFHWQQDSEGYFIVDHEDQPIALFQDRELDFLLNLRDRLQRGTEFQFTVEFDDTHLRRKPNLRIIRPVSFTERMNRAKEGIRQFLSASRSR